MCVHGQVHERDNLSDIMRVCKFLERDTQRCSRLIHQSSVWALVTSKQKWCFARWKISYCWPRESGLWVHQVHGLWVRDCSASEEARSSSCSKSHDYFAAVQLFEKEDVQRSVCVQGSECPSRAAILDNGPLAGAADVFTKMFSTSETVHVRLRLAQTAISKQEIRMDVTNWYIRLHPAEDCTLSEIALLSHYSDSVKCSKLSRFEIEKETGIKSQHKDKALCQRYVERETLRWCRDSVGSRVDNINNLKR